MSPADLARALVLIVAATAARHVYLDGGRKFRDALVYSRHFRALHDAAIVKVPDEARADTLQRWSDALRILAATDGAVLAPVPADELDVEASA